MSERPTPETDAIVEKHRPYSGSIRAEAAFDVMSHKSRQIERQRDDAAEELAALRAERDKLADEVAKQDARLTACYEVFDCRPSELVGKIKELHAAIKTDQRGPAAQDGAGDGNDAASQARCKQSGPHPAAIKAAQPNYLERTYPTFAAIDASITAKSMPPTTISELKAEAEECFEKCNDYACVRTGWCTGIAGKRYDAAQEGK